FVTAMSAGIPPGTVVFAKAVLFSSLGSVEPLLGSGGVLTFTSLVMMVPEGVPELTVTTKVNTSSALTGTLERVQVRLPVCDGSLHVQFGDAVTEANVVSWGIRSNRVAVTEGSGPLFVT